MQQLAWFHSTPTDAASKQKSKGGGLKKQQPKSRMEQVREKGGEPLLPDPGDAVYLLGYWYDLGMVQNGGMSATRITSTELMNWSQGTGTPLTAWEFSTLRAMSVAYLQQAHISETPDCPPPHGAVISEVTRVQIDKKLKNMFASFQTKAPK